MTSSDDIIFNGTGKDAIFDLFRAKAPSLWLWRERLRTAHQQRTRGHTPDA
jgi:hypothetical protein